MLLRLSRRSPWSRLVLTCSRDAGMSPPTPLRTILMIHLAMTASAHGPSVISSTSSESFWVRAYEGNAGALSSGTVTSVPAGSPSECWKACYLKGNCDEFCFNATSKECFAGGTAMVVYLAAWDSVRCYRRMSASIAGYSLHGGRYLKLHTASAERPDGNVAAAGICATEHARLFNMSTAEDAELLRLLVKQQDAYLNILLVGVKKSGQYFLWAAEVGIVLPENSELWDMYEPSTAGGHSDCILMDLQMGKLSTFDCTIQYVPFVFVCEMAE